MCYVIEFSVFKALSQKLPQPFDRILDKMGNTTQPFCCRVGVGNNLVIPPMPWCTIFVLTGNRCNSIIRQGFSSV